MQDYKVGSKVDGGKGMLERGKLQLQLYLLAAREIWGLDLAGGLYRPLGATSQRAPKGLLRKELAEDLAPLGPAPARPPRRRGLRGRRSTPPAPGPRRSSARSAPAR